MTAKPWMDDPHWPPATEESPDRSTCRNCQQPISWDEVCYTHDDTGFSDCGVMIDGGTKIGPITVDPELTVNPFYHGTRAEPITWGLEGKYPSG